MRCCNVLPLTSTNCSPGFKRGPRKLAGTSRSWYRSPSMLLSRLFIGDMVLVLVNTNHKYKPGCQPCRTDNYKMLVWFMAVALVPVGVQFQISFLPSL